jgi:hypothetical protein
VGVEFAFSCGLLLKNFHLDLIIREVAKLQASVSIAFRFISSEVSQYRSLPRIYSVLCRTNFTP